MAKATLNIMRLSLVIIFFICSGCTSRHNSNITELDLSNHSLSTIPDSVFSLSNLEYLQLGNEFIIYPPLSALGADTPSGKSLNKITAIQSDIVKLHQLRVFRICFNNLQSLPAEIVQLKELDTLDISFNEDLNITAELGKLKKMTGLRYLNIVATKADEASIDKLRKALPDTKIDAKPEDLLIDSVTSQ